MATENVTTEPKKAKKKKEKRKYPKKDVFRKFVDMDDARLLQLSRLWHSLFSDHVAAFSAFDASLDANFATDWLGLIELFENLETDETIVDGLKDKSDTLAAETKNFLAVIDDLEYFVKQAFPNDARKLKEFGFDKLRQVKANYTGQLLVMSITMSFVVDLYIAQLTAVGMTNQLGTDFGNALMTLLFSEVEQEIVTRVRIRTTTDRINMFNQLLVIHWRVLAAAKIVFRQNAVVAKQFE